MFLPTKTSLLGCLAYLMTHCVTNMGLLDMCSTTSDTSWEEWRSIHYLIQLGRSMKSFLFSRKWLGCPTENAELLRCALDQETNLNFAEIMTTL